MTLLLITKFYNATNKLYKNVQKFKMALYEGRADGPLSKL